MPRELEKALEVYTQQVVTAGAQVMRERRGLATVLDAQFSALYSGLAPPGGETVSLRYVCGVELKQDEAIAANYRRLLDDAAGKEANLRYTTVGPHRDDLGFHPRASARPQALRQPGPDAQRACWRSASRCATSASSGSATTRSCCSTTRSARWTTSASSACSSSAPSARQVFITSASEREVELIAPLATAVYQVQDASVERRK